MFRQIIKYSILKLRNEQIKIGNFSSFDLIRILFKRISSFIRAFFIFTLRFKKIGINFVGYQTILIGLEKIQFGKTITIGNFVKISSIGSSGYKIGNNFSIRDFSIIDSFGSLKKESGNLSIGNNVGISEYCYFAIRGNLTIGDDVIFGPGVKIFTENHSFELTETRFRLQDEIRQDVKIGSNVWIGANVTILAGVTIADNIVIAAGSVVNKDLFANSLYGGIPAKVLKNLN